MQSKGFLNIPVAGQTNCPLDLVVDVVGDFVVVTVILVVVTGGFVTEVVTNELVVTDEVTGKFVVVDVICELNVVEAWTLVVVEIIGRVVAVVVVSSDPSCN